MSPALTGKRFLVVAENIHKREGWGYPRSFICMQTNASYFSTVSHFHFQTGEGMENMQEITVLNNLVLLNSGSFDSVQGPWDERRRGVIEMRGARLFPNARSTKQAHFTIIRGHSWWSVEMSLIKTKCFIKTPVWMSSLAKINSLQFLQIPTQISILITVQHVMENLLLFAVFFFYSAPFLPIIPPISIFEYLPKRIISCMQNVTQQNKSLAYFAGRFGFCSPASWAECKLLCAVGTEGLIVFFYIFILCESWVEALMCWRICTLFLTSSFSVAILADPCFHTDPIWVHGGFFFFHCW